jgi:hypothetical protein
LKTEISEPMIDFPSLPVKFLPPGIIRLLLTDF